VKGLHLVRPGGLVVVLTSRYTMDARNPAARREMAGLADLVGAVRLPSGAHQRAAGTAVVTDLLVLRRREADRDPAGVEWEQARLTKLDGAEVPVNQYFLDHPEHVLGEMGTEHGMHGADDLVVRAATGVDTAAALGQLLDGIAGQARSAGLMWRRVTAFAAGVVQAPGERSAEPDGFLRARADGVFTRVELGREVLYEVPRSQVAELRHLIGLRDVVRALLDREAGSRDDTPEIEQLRVTLNKVYDGYLRSYGPLNRFTLRLTGRVDPVTGEPVMAKVQPSRGGFRDDPFAPLVSALEEFDPVGQRAAKAAIFRERVVAPRAARLGADTGADALAICLIPAVRCGLVRSLGCSGPARTRLASSWGRWYSMIRSPGGWFRRPSTCRGTCGTSCGLLSRPAATSPGSRSMRLSCGRLCRVI